MNKSDFAKLLDEKFEPIERRLGNVENHLGHFEKRLGNVENHLDHVEKGLTKVEHTMATKEDLERFATKEDLERFATKEDLERFATKEDLESLQDVLLEAIEKLGDGISDIFITLEKRVDRLEEHLNLTV